MAFGGAALRFGQTGLRAIELLAAIVALVIFSYFLAVLSDHKLPIATWIRAVEGISGSAVLYLLFAVFLTLCLGGVAFFGFIAVVLDVAFAITFIYTAWETRHGAGSCTGRVITPLGTGQANSNDPGYGKGGFGFGSNENVTYLPNLHQACRLNTATFAVSIILIFLFLTTAVLQFLLVRHHKKEKRFGPSPSNNYTSGFGKGAFWKRNKKVTNTHDAEMATAGSVAGTHHANRISHDTGYTGTTMEGAHGLNEPKYGEPGYGNTITTATRY